MGHKLWSKWLMTKNPSRSTKSSPASRAVGRAVRAGYVSYIDIILDMATASLNKGPSGVMIIIVSGFKLAMSLATFLQASPVAFIFSSSPLPISEIKMGGWGMT